MPANKIIRIGPVFLSTTLTTNIVNCNITSLAGPIGYTQTQPYLVIRHFKIINRTGTAATFSLWLGATGANTAGTEVLGSGTSIPANLAYDSYDLLRLDAADFLVGGSGTASALVFMAEAEIGLV